MTNIIWKQKYIILVYLTIKNIISCDKKQQEIKNKEHKENKRTGLEQQHHVDVWLVYQLLAKFVI